jgi:hypothetical protein
LGDGDESLSEDWGRPMTKNKHLSRKTNRIVRTPATRFGHLQKRLRKVGKPCAGKKK